MGLLLLLGFTFYLGARPVRKGRILLTDSMRSTATSGTARALSFMSRSTRRASGPSAAESTGDGGGGSLFAHPFAAAAAAGDGGGDVNSGGEGSSSRAASGLVPPSTASLSEGESERRAQRPRPSARRVWKNGPGDQADVEQVQQAVQKTIG